MVFQNNFLGVFVKFLINPYHDTPADILVISWENYGPKMMYDVLN